MNIKNLLFTFAAGAAIVSQAYANPQVNMGIYDAGSGGNYRANPNGELEWVLSNYVAGKSTDGTWFGTFCIEKNEYFSNGGLYDVAINDRAIAGGVSSPTVGFDIISQGSAFLYTQFATGLLSNSYYGSSSQAGSLQNMIWYLEGEQNSWGADTTFSSLLNTQFGANWIVDAKNDFTGSSVKVMNLTSNQGQNRHQDQLVYVGVPDAGMTSVLFGLGLCGVAYARRQVRKV